MKFDNITNNILGNSINDLYGSEEKSNKTSTERKLQWNNTYGTTNIEITNGTNKVIKYISICLKLLNFIFSDTIENNVIGSMATSIKRNDNINIDFLKFTNLFMFFFFWKKYELNAKKESENDTKIKYINNIFKLCSAFLDKLNITSNAEKNTAKNIPTWIQVKWYWIQINKKRF